MGTIKFLFFLFFTWHFLIGWDFVLYTRVQIACDGVCTGSFGLLVNYPQSVWCPIPTEGAPTDEPSASAPMWLIVLFDGFLIVCVCVCVNRGGEAGILNEKNVSKLLLARLPVNLYMCRLRLYVLKNSKHKLHPVFYPHCLFTTGLWF